MCTKYKHMKIQEHSHNSQQGNSAEGGDQGRQDDTGMQQQPKILCVGVCMCVCVCISFFFICSHMTKASAHPRATYLSPFILSFGFILLFGPLGLCSQLTSSKIFFPLSPHLFLIFFPFSFIFWQPIDKPSSKTSLKNMQRKIASRPQKI